MKWQMSIWTDERSGGFSLLKHLLDWLELHRLLLGRLVNVNGGGEVRPPL